VLGRIRQHGFPGQRGPGDIVAQDVLELDGLRRRGDVIGRDVGQDRVLVEDVVQLTLEPAQLILGQAEAGEIRDVFDVAARQGGHAPDDSRVSRTPPLRPMTLADIDQTVAAILADRFGDRRAWFEFAVANEACHPFVAAADGEIVGSGVATVNGPIAWIGTIWVAPGHRRHGLGTALTDAVVDAAAMAGSRTLVLVATDRGRPLYERLGFEVQTWYRTFEAPGLGPMAGDHGPIDRVRRFQAADLERIGHLDAIATGEDRRTLLRALTGPDGTRVLEGDDGEVRGFQARAPWGGGATVAPDVDDALTLLRARRRASVHDKRVRCGILIENEAGAEALERDGWTEAWRAPRLIRGQPMTWHPEQIWGQFNHAVG
jgi:GNAT superfamily N-acetyltransferase